MMHAFLDVDGIIDKSVRKECPLKTQVSVLVLVLSYISARDASRPQRP